MLQRVHMPSDLGEAAGLLANDPTAALLAGGTLLMPAVNNEVTPIQSLVSTKRLGLEGIAVEGDRARIGAATRLADVGADPRLAFLHPVIEAIASPPIRNLATVGEPLRLATIRRSRRCAPRTRRDRDGRRAAGAARGSCGGDRR